MITPIICVYFYLGLLQDLLAAGYLNPSMKQLCFLLSQIQLRTQFLSLKEPPRLMIYSVI